MEKDRTKMEKIFTILLFPVALIFLLGLLIITPFDYLKYKRTQYYKDTHEKYSWLCTSSCYINLYDSIKKENLPIEYYRCDYSPITGYGYFVYRDTLILNDYESDEPYYDTEKNIWTVKVEDEYIDIREDVEGTIERCNDLLKSEVCKRAIVLIDSEIYSEHPDVKYEKFDFLPVNDNNDIKALKAIIN